MTPAQHLPTLTPAAGKVKPTKSRRARWRQTWDQSLGFRLLTLGLMPLLLAFPVVIAILVVVGGDRAENLMEVNLRSNLAGSRNYLEQLRSEAATRTRQLATSERLMSLVNPDSANRELNQALGVMARSGGLDFLIVASSDGRVIGSSTGLPPGTTLPDSHVIRQARLGVASAAFELFPADQLGAFSPQFAAQARVVPAPTPTKEPDPPTPGLLIHAAAHFPLAVNSPDAILVGGILVNRNEALIEHMREIIYPLGTLPGDAEGVTAIYIDGLKVAVSRQRQRGERSLGSLAPPAVLHTVLGQGKPWLGQLDFDGDRYMSGFEPLEDSQGRRIGMIGVRFPAAPYQQAALLLLGAIAGLLALTMLAISLLFLRTGRELTQRLHRIGETMTAVSQGDRLARVGPLQRQDELGALAHHFDGLLDTIAAQDAEQQLARQGIADEASRRRTLFEKVHDGIVILNPDGTVFEANPRFADMLGYSPLEAQYLQIEDWDAGRAGAGLSRQLAHASAVGRTFESEIRQRDGSTFPVEISLSRTEWAGQVFIFCLVRDIAERKATEIELEQHRRTLEALVEQRTKELNERSEQLDAIFALSPDGFVSFDPQGRVNFVNGAFLRMAGLEGMDIVGKDEPAFTALLRGKCLPQAMFQGVATLRSELDQQSAGSAPVSNRRQLFELAAPASRVLEVGLRLAEKASNVSYILHFRDVTYETEVDRMKSEFLSTAAHELRTPMASIYGYTELLRAREFDAPRRQQLLETISRQSQLMSSIINELLDLARIESRRGKDFVIERHALQDILAEAVSGYKVPAGRNSPVVVQPDQPLYVEVDQQKILQALLNILSNAYKYSPKGGEVNVSLQVDDTPGARRVGIEVRDQGIGMKPEELARVFERFYRADASGNIPGTGLGMSIVKEIVELHRGEVRLASETGRGTTVLLWLPLAD
ncbi:MAG: ATP-binding protein [Hylemonella sp.]|nr:ATP-binding protein [Hylemonella sp.]